MNQYIKKGLLATLMLIPMFAIFAQYKSVNLLNDTINSENATPGKLFDNTVINNTGSVATVAGETLNKVTVPNLLNTLPGQLSGLFTVQGNGLPGNDDPVWAIRGVGSYGLGYFNSAKIYVDGFEVTSDYLSYLSPAEIESVSVLKDAASLSTFGMRGANGVIWVKTKRGQIKEPTVTLQVRSGLQQAINTYKPLDSYNFANLYNQAVSNDNGAWTPYYSQSQLDGYKNGTGTNISWYDEVMKSQGNYSDVNFIFNGGVERAKYNIVLAYANQQGLYNVENTDQTSNQKMDRFNVRANFDFNLFDIVDASVDLGARLENRKQPHYWNVMNDLASYPSNIYPVYDELVVDDESNYSGTALYPNNPVGSIKGLGWYSSRARVLQGNFKFREKLDFITPGLYLQEAFSFYVRSSSTYSKTRNYARYFNGVPTTTDQTTSIVASGYGTGGMDQWMQGSLSVGYDKDIDKHAIRFLLDFHISDFKGEGFFNYRQHYLNLSGKVNYAYDSRYVAELGFSYFGSDAYKKGNRWGFYPTLSGAWIISNEEFLKDNDNVSFAKLRASVGRSGEINTNVTDNTSFQSNGRALYQQYYAWSRAFYTGISAPFSGQGSLVPQFIANENVFAEQSMKYNIGLDVSFLNKLNVTADVFMDKRSNILTRLNSQMGYYGDYNYLDNIGKMTNKGVELSAAYTDKINDFNYSIHGLLSYAINTIDFMDEVAPAFPYNAYTGRAYGTVLGLQAEGFYQIEDFDANGNLKQDMATPLFGAVQPGDIRYKDLDGNGFIDQTDVTEIGNPVYPNLAYSFGAQAEFKGLDFSILFQGASGASVNLLNRRAQFVAFVDNGNAFENALGAWAYYPDQGIDTRNTATYPRLTTQSNENNYRNSSFWMKNNSYLRIKNVELGYDLMSNLLRVRGISSLRVFLNAVNPLTFSSLLTDYDMDPESGYGYPALKSYNVGLSITF